ncbi:MAG TPA: BTAD domain-containing putative transcriptional regulator [Gemmatimonadaceae bacterium]|nr:BTAD domain-containing putative transcriptional regulator [Gemmatimonadaceae bacterium]
MLNRLFLFGQVRLTGPKESSLRRAAQQRRLALLALIASSPGETISRDRALGLLWPDRDEHTARHLLADSIYVLRRTLGEHVITASGETLRLSASSLPTDIVEFRRAFAEERWSDALDLYRGDFLDGFFVRNAADFEQWAMGERVRLRTLAVRAAVRLTAVHRQTGNVGDAIAAAERAHDLEPADETLFRSLIELLVAAGNTVRAEAAARLFVERLATDVGISPSAETARLLRELKGARGNEPVVVFAPREPNRAQQRRHELDSVTAGIILQGRYHWQQRTRSSLERAIIYFNRAIERDKRAVEAWTGLADTWAVMGGRGYAPRDHAIDRAVASAERALALDDTRSSAHTSMGGVNIIRQRWNESEAALRRAIQLDPRNAAAHHWLSLTLLTGLGAREEAMREQAIAASLNPISPIHFSALGWQRYLLGDYGLSRTSMEPAVDLSSDLEEGVSGLARAAARLGDETTVQTAINTGLSRRNDLRGDLLAEQASAFAVLGDRRRARELARKASRYAAMPLNLALAWASVGDCNRAFDQLERESFQVYWAPHAIWWDPRFDAIRDDARFARAEERALRAWAPEWK